MYKHCHGYFVLCAVDFVNSCWRDKDKPPVSTFSIACLGALQTFSGVPGKISPCLYIPLTYISMYVVDTMKVVACSSSLKEAKEG